MAKKPSYEDIFHAVLKQRAFGSELEMAKHKSKKKSQDKIEKVMHEFKEGDLKSGSKSGPTVTNPKQAIAIAISESKRKKKK